MDDTHVEIHEIAALRVDGNGRVGRLRILGVADRDDQRISIDACVADMDASESSWVLHDQEASATARIVDPKRTFVGYGEPAFVMLKPKEDRRRAYLWVAEINVLLSPAVPPIFIGRQQVPVNVRARYVYDSSSGVTRKVTEIAPIKEFDAGVLLVHGIGKQRRSETLSQWSAPLLRWINAWLHGATDDIARRLQGAPLEGWLHGLLVRGDFSEYDIDRVDRAGYANELVRKALEPTYGDWRAEIKAVGERTKSTSELRSPTTAERNECHQTVHLIEELKASAVGGAAEFREAYVLDVGAHSADPSSVEMHVEAMAGDGYMLRSRWMLAESHWGESFWAPSFFGFGRWCLLTAPVVLVHYIAMARLRHAKSLLRSALPVLGLSTSVMLAQLAFLLLMVLWLVPWDRLRAYVLQIQLGLAGIVGDSYVLLEDPVQRRAILDRVERDLNWLVQRCRRVVVIAHSQGAAVAELVLSNREGAGAENIHSFVTLGSGVQTLKAIEKLAHSRDVNIAGWMAIGCVVALGVAVVVALSGAWPIAAVIAVVALLGLALAAERAWNAHPGRPTVLPRAAWFRSWFDFFATKDLVPYGPLVDPENNGENYRPKEVRNRDSYLADHVEYWQNPEQVIGPLARQVGSAAGFVPLTNLLPDDDNVLARLERARISRLGFLRAAHGVVALATALLLAVQWPAWVAIGRWALSWAQSMLGSAAASVPRPGFSVWLQAAIVLLPLLIYKTLINATFDAWTTAETERLLRRSVGSPATHWTTTFVLLLVLTLAPTIFFVWPLTPWVAVAVTALALATLAWLARRIHRQRVERHGLNHP